MHENTEDSLLYGLLGNIYGTYEVDRIEEAIMMFEKAYRFSSDDNYLSTADKLRNGGHIDSVFLNGAIIEIYTDYEVIELYRTLHWINFIVYNRFIRYCIIIFVYRREIAVALVRCPECGREKVSD